MATFETAQGPTTVSLGLHIVRISTENHRSSALKSLRIPPHPSDKKHGNIKWKNRKERLNRSKDNGDMADTAKSYVVCE